MDLEEAIRHCEEKSCGNSPCAQDHQQLAEWLKELKELKNRDKEVPKLLDGIGQTRLGFTYEQIQAIERYVRTYIDYALRPQSHWKPSEEQMRILSLCNVSGLMLEREDILVLKSLYEDLKAL